MLSHKLSGSEQFKMCWTSSYFTFIQKVRWTYGFFRNKLRQKLNLRTLPIRV